METTNKLLKNRKNLAFMVSFLLLIISVFVLYTMLKQQNKRIDYFQKKQECSKSITQANEKIKYLKNTLGGFTFVDKVFYSPIKNSCFYAISGWYDISKHKENKMIKLDFQNWAKIIDSFTGEIIWEIEMKTSEIDNNENFRKPILDKLKNEINVLEKNN